MRKLLMIAILLPCLLLFAETVDRALVVIKKGGDKIAVLLDDIDSVIIDKADLIDGKYFLLDKDTINIHDTLTLHDTLTIRDVLTLHDTLTIRDTLTLHDSIDIHDTLIQIITLHDTLWLHDTLTLRDTINIHDTLTLRDTINIHDTLTLRDTVNIHDTLTVRDTVNIHDTKTILEVITNNVYANESWYHNLENPTASSFINEVEYDPNDYSYSLIDNYLGETSYPKERPMGVRVKWDEESDLLEVSENADFSRPHSFKLSEGSREFVVNNLIPGCKYYWRVSENGVASKSSHFFTTGRLRMINADKVYNIRDIGGIETSDGHRLAYGRVYRGGTLANLTPNDSLIFVDSLGITAELNVADALDTLTSPNLGKTVELASFQGRHVNFIPYYGKDFANEVKQVLEFLRAGKVIYLHCGGGADRTGAVCLLLEGLAGCSESDMAKDYELTSFSQFGERKRIDGIVYNGTTYNYAKTIKWLKNRSGGSLQEKITNYLQTYGMTYAEINELRELLLE